MSDEVFDQEKEEEAEPVPVSPQPIHHDPMGLPVQPAETSETVDDDTVDPDEEDQEPMSAGYYDDGDNEEGGA